LQGPKKTPGLVSGGKGSWGKDLPPRYTSRAKDREVDVGKEGIYRRDPLGMLRQAENSAKIEDRKRKGEENERDQPAKSPNGEALRFSRLGDREGKKRYEIAKQPL